MGGGPEELLWEKGEGGWAEMSYKEGLELGMGISQSKPQDYKQFQRELAWVELRLAI